MGTTNDPFVLKYRRRANKTPRSVLKHIRTHCIECMGGQVAEVARCTEGGPGVSIEEACPLWAFRMGVNQGSNKK